MLITSLEQMANIVSNNKSLSWIGWDVVYRSFAPTGWTDTSGVFIKGEWYSQKKFEITSNGWEIPDRFVR